jgi:NTE family protein
VAEEGVLVDGGVINNLPTIEMAQQCFGPILAVDVSRNLGITPKSWTDLIKQPLLTRIFKPPLISLLIRTGTVSGEEQYREQTESSYATFNPPLGGIDLRDWKAYDEAVEAGYQYMKAELEANEDLKVMCKVCGFG